MIYLGDNERARMVLNAWLSKFHQGLCQIETLSSPYLKDSFNLKLGSFDKGKFSSSLINEFPVEPINKHEVIDINS